MDYKKLYYSIIEKRQQCSPTGYTEKHHVIPRSLGGTDDKENLVNLTAREHFLCHYLLAKMYSRESPEWYKMNHAFMMMKSSSATQQRYFNSRLYESLKSNMSGVMSKLQQGNKNSQYGKRWIHSVELQRSIKIPKNDPLPKGWHEGRKVNWNLVNTCPQCGEEFLKSLKKYCSQECKHKSTNPFYGKEQEFLDLYKEYKSMNKALKAMGYPGAISHYYRWAKLVLHENT
ncbi:MAG: hypothetical protein CMP47_12265 [Rickettsiales bacterium]|nr:hypothetical protein [Rickettsiales bacterium]